ncbi:MAG: arylesterase [Rhodocyclaceae bacterium]|jgi:acyl-CoA thioesterase-1|nr:arylesterase [Rhodocyclaceae bacterium]
MLFRSIATFFLFIFCAGAHASTILVWGDSLSAGYGLQPEQAWPTLLQTRLTERGFPHAVINASVSGETTSGGRSRLPAALEQHQPTLLILELGANDGLRGLRPQLMADNLAAMIETAQARGARVLLLGMQMPPNYGPGYTRRFAASFHEVAEQTGADLLPFLMEGFADQREMFLDDGIHPTAEAQHLILDNVWTVLEPLLAGAQQAGTP